jgi:hypothetical protein
MRGARSVSSIIVFTLGVFLFRLSSASAGDQTDSEFRHKVTALINSESTVHIQGIEIESDDQAQFNLEISANVGNGWGKEELARRFARESLKALFISDLPISHVVLKVYGDTKILLTVALGKNQGKILTWDNNESLNLFFEHMKSNMTYSGNPNDYCWLIENNAAN